MLKLAVISACIAMPLCASSANAATSACKGTRTAFSLKVTGTNCPTGRSVARAYARTTLGECEGDGCVIRARDRRWRCKYRILRASDTPADENGNPVIRGQVRCKRLADGAVVRWQYSGGGD